MPGTILIGVDVETASENSANYARLGPELLAAAGVRATWYVTGRTMEKYPELFAQAERGGVVDVQMHTYDHLLLKTVLIQVPAGREIHGKKDWVLVRGGSNEQINLDLARCQRVFQDVLGRPARGLTAPWCYYRGLGDRPDLLEIVHAHGIRWLRALGRDERDGQPVPMAWQPYFYTAQAFPNILEICVHDYQDDFYYVQFNGLADASTYPAHLRKLADRVAAENLVWSLASHDHSCQSPEAFKAKTSWMVDVIGYAKSLGIRFLTGTEYYAERTAAAKAQDAQK